MKKILALILALTMVFGLVACGAKEEAPAPSTAEEKADVPAEEKAEETKAPAADDGKVYEMVFATHVGENHPVTKALYQFAEQVETESNGRIQITTYINSELGDPNEVTEQIRVGVIDGGIFTTGMMALYNDKLNATMWPYMFMSYEHAANAYAGEVGQYMKDMAAEGGFEVLDWMYYGFRNLSSNRIVNSVEDIKGLSLRVPSERVNQLTMQAYGANCNIIAANELYLALSQGVVDGQENPLATMDTYNIQEVNKFVAMIEYTFFTSGMVVNPDKFNALPADLQEIIRKASADAAAYEMEIFVEEENAVIEKFEAAGVTFTYPDKEEFVAAAQPAMDELKQDYDAAFVEEWLAMIEASKA